MEILLTHAGSTYNVTGLVTRVQWTGDYRQCARTLDISLVSSPHDSAVPDIPCPVGAAVTMRADGAVFSGFVISRTKSTQGNTIDLVCYDRGFYLKSIELSRKLTAVRPEDAARELCGMYRIETGEIAATGVRITRNFPGSTLWDMLRTVYVLAGEQAKKAYHIGFEGAALCVREKVPSAQTPVIEGGSCLMDATTTESMQQMVNSVVITDDAGKTVRTLARDSDIAAYGLMRRVIKQDKESDRKAQELLDKGVFEQKITVNTLGDARFTAGRCVLVREPYTGLRGLFWIDTDTHQWKSGVYTAKLTLSFQAMMDEAKAGEEVK